MFLALYGFQRQRRLQRFYFHDASTLNRHPGNMSDIEALSRAMMSSSVSILVRQQRGSSCEWKALNNSFREYDQKSRNTRFNSTTMKTSLALLKVSSRAQLPHCRRINAGQTKTPHNCAWCQAEYAAELRTLNPSTSRFHRLKAEILRLKSPGVSHGICKRHLAMEVTNCTHEVVRSRAKRVLNKPHVTKRERRSRTSR